MKYKRADHTSFTIEHLICVVGGNDWNIWIKAVECYNPSNDQWNMLSQLTITREDPSAIAINNHTFYVFGGFTITTKKVVYLPISNFEMHDLALGRVK